MTVWAQTCGINRKTTGILPKEDIVSKDTLILLTEEDYHGIRPIRGPEKTGCSSNRSS